MRAVLGAGGATHLLPLKPSEVHLNSRVDVVQSAECLGVAHAASQRDRFSGDISKCGDAAIDFIRWMVRGIYEIEDALTAILPRTTARFT